MVVVMILVSGCTSASLRVSGYAPIAGWVAEKTIGIQEYFCDGMHGTEERSAETYTDNGMTNIDVEYNCFD